MFSGDESLLNPIDLAPPRRVPRYPDDNPKTAEGAKKAPLHLVPATAVHAEAYAFKDGADKYGAYNWREKAVSVTTYVAAARRHIDRYFDGLDAGDIVPDSASGCSHLAAVRACMAILIDAQAAGMLNDDRPKKLVDPLK